MSDSVDIFCERKAQFEKPETLPNLGFSPNTKALPQSIIQSYLLHCQAKEATHTWKDLGKAMCPGNGWVGLWLGVDKKKAVSLSNGVVQSRIGEMSSNVLHQVMEESAATPFPFFWMKLLTSLNAASC